MTLHALVAGAGGFPRRSATEEERAAGAAPLRPLPRVAEAVKEVAQALAAAGAGVGPPLIDPTRTEWDTAWRTARERAGRDPLVVHFCGHGLLVDTDLYLAVSGTSTVRNRIRDTAVEVEALLKDVRQGDGGPVLFLLDVCHAGAALRPQLVARLSGVTDRRTWVIAACDADAITYGARFSSAAADVLNRLARRKLVVPAEFEHVPVELLAQEMDTALARADLERGEPKQDVVRTPHNEAALPPAPILPNPWHGVNHAERLWAGYDAGLRAFAAFLDPQLDVVHFVTRATGTGHAAPFFFSGRARQLARMQRWLDDPDGDQDRLLVVTGSPGAGKSALLGAAVCMVHPQFGGLRMDMAIEGFRPRTDPGFVAVHASGLTTRQVVASLYRQLHGRQTADAPGVRAGTVTADGLSAVLGARGGVTVAVDALDEAADAEELLEEVLLPLAGRAPEDRTPGCRVLIGTRLWPGSLPALHTALAGRPRSLIDLDEEDPDVLARDLAAYLGRLLGPDYAPEVARALGHRLAHSLEQGVFLTAFLHGTHVRTLVAAGAPPTAAEILRDLPCDLPGMLELNLRTLLAEEPWTGPVLAALARAAGPGMPPGMVHAVALALDPGAARRLLPPRLEDTRRVMHLGRFYLRGAHDGDRRLYRFFHRALAEHLAPRADAGDVLRALLARVPATGGIRDWAAADPYLLRHLADHAAQAGPEELDELLADPGHLLHAEPDRLVPHLHRARGALARSHADVYRHSTAHDPRRDDVTVRRDLLDLDATVWGRPALAEALGTPPAALARPRWAVSSTAFPARLHTLPHGGEVRRVALVPVSGDGDAAEAVVTAGDDGRLRRWDVLRGRPLPAPAGGPARAPAPARLSDGRSVLVSGGDGRVFVHDLRTGGLVRSLADPDGRAVRLLTALTVRDGAWAVTAGKGKEILFWDLEAGRLRHAVDSPAVVVRALAAAELPGGGAVALAAGDEYEAMVWDLRSGRRRHTLGPHPDFVRAAATARRRDGAVVAVTGCRDGAVLVWDLSDGRPVHALHGHGDWVTAVAAGTVGDRCLAVSGDRSGRVLVWDLDTGEPRHDLRDGHGVITRAALGGGAAVVVTGCADGRVTVWDLATGRRTHGFAAHADGVHDVDVGRAGERLVAVSGGADGRAVVWDVTAAGPDAPGTGHTEAVTAVAVAAPREAGVPQDAEALLVAGGGERTAEVRDLAGGRVLHELRDGERPLLVRAVTTAELPTAGRVALTGSRDGLLRVWSLADGSLLRSWDSRTGRVRAMASGRVPDGRTVLAAGGDEGTATVWDPETGRRLAVFTGHGDARILALAAVPGTAGTAVSGDDRGTLLVWDLRSGEEAAALTRSGGRFDAIATAVLSDGRTVAVSAEAGGGMRLWDLGLRAAPLRLAGPERSVTALATARLRDGRVLFLGGGADCRVSAWDPDGGTPAPAPYHLPAPVSAIAASATGFVVAHSAGTACFTWEAALPDRPPAAD
ncbi:hypothetical protein ACF061_22600 [Streptomyces sp. NPDC015220]|uniref:hypothetical protein n=1 Tax=Streptomyces sp. NPDC015220 TaxID=3364947 RepID=UPI0037010A82